MREFVIKALRNYGYRFLGNHRGCYTFGKPLGYGILRADIRKVITPYALHTAWNVNHAWASLKVSV